MYKQPPSTVTNLDGGRINSFCYQVGNIMSSYVGVASRSFGIHAVFYATNNNNIISKIPALEISLKL